MNSNKLDEAFAGQSALRFELGGGDQEDYGDQSGTDDDLISQQHVMVRSLPLVRLARSCIIMVSLARSS